MVMLDEAKLEAELMRDEAFRSQTYRCTAGKLTIGYGRNLDDRGLTREEVASLGLGYIKKDAVFGREAADLVSKGITRDQALLLLRNDIQRIKNDFNRRLAWWIELSDVRQRVLVNMAFNMGVNGLLGFKHMLAAARGHDYVNAVKHMNDSKWVRENQTGARANRLANMMLEG